MTMRYKESPEPPPPGMVPADWDNKIMHTCLRIGDANVMASDGCSDGPNFKGFSLSLTAANAEADAGRKFNALAEGDRFRCHSERLSGRLVSAWSQIVSASAGWLPWHSKVF